MAGEVAYVPRVIDAVLEARLRSAGAVVVEGPKACGKTFTASRVARSQTRLDIDRNARAALQIDPSLVLGGEPPQLIDEWQLEADAVWNHVRYEVDQRRRPGQFILTGSSLPVDEERRHTGAGRFARLAMRPMSLFETGESTGTMSLAALLAGERPTASRSDLTVADVARLIVRGGWPSNLPLGVEEAAQANVDHLRNVAEVDLPRLDDGGRRDPLRTARFMQALARNTAMDQKVARLAVEAAVDDGPWARTTAYEYLRALQRLMILEEVTAWSTHLRSRATLRSAPRTHLADPSLAAAALEAGPARLLSDLNTLGLLFESLVVRDCRVYAEPLGATVHYYRDNTGLEVDLVVQRRSGAWGAFEVKLGAGQVDEAARHLLAMAERVDTDRAGAPAVLGVVTATGFGYTRPDGVVVVPVGAFGP